MYSFKFISRFFLCANFGFSYFFLCFICSGTLILWFLFHMFFCTYCPFYLGLFYNANNVFYSCFLFMRSNWFLFFNVYFYWVNFFLFASINTISLKFSIYSFISCFHHAFSQSFIMFLINLFSLEQPFLLLLIFFFTIPLIFFIFFCLCVCQVFH